MLTTKKTALPLRQQLPQLARMVPLMPESAAENFAGGPLLTVKSSNPLIADEVDELAAGVGPDGS